MSSAKRSKAPQSTGFPSKRVKTRVGKRAPKPANVTDTGFRAVSVRTAHQTALEEEHEKKKSLYQLVSRLSHASPPVRKSSLVGIQTVVSASNHGNSIAALLVPAVSKCTCVDPDSSVRDAGFKVMQSLIIANVAQPFASIILAFVASALTSMDQSVRLQGCRVLGLVCSANMMHQNEMQLLPSFARLLQDASRIQKKNISNKAKRSNKQEENGRVVILQSLVSLLSWGEEHNDNMDAIGRRQQQKHPHHVFVVGSKNTTNGVFVASDSRRSSKCTIEVNSIQDLSAFVAPDGESTMSISSKQVESNTLPTAIACVLLTRLRDLFVELTQEDTNDATGSGTDPQRLEEISLLLVSMRLLWNRHCQSQVMNKQDEQSSKLESLASQVLSILLQAFPIVAPQHHNSDVSSYETVSAKMSSTIMDMGIVLDANGKKSNWIQQVLDHVLVTDTGDESNTTSHIVVDIMSRLMLMLEPSFRSKQFALEDCVRCKVFRHVCDLYFDCNKLNQEVAASQAGRRAAKLVVDLVELNCNSNTTDDRTLLMLMRQAVQCLPQYLLVWDVNHLEDTDAVLSCLLDVARRYDCNKDCTDSDGNAIASSDLIGKLRSGVGDNLFHIQKNKSGKQKKKAGATTAKSMLFERYPPLLQRRVMGLIGMLQSPTSTVVDGLSNTCAKRQADKPVLDYVVQVMHTVRRTVSMQTYLTFVVSSIGIRSRKVSRRHQQEDEATLQQAEAPFQSEANETDALPDSKKPSVVHATYSPGSLMEYDDALRRACRVLCQCGSKNVLPALEPVLSNWIQDRSTEQGLTQTRASVSILASLAMDTKACSDAAVNAKSDSVFDVLPGFAGPVAQAVSDMMPSFFSCSGGEIEVYHQLIRPVSALMECEPQILEAMFQKTAARMRHELSSANHLDGDWAEQTLRAMLEILQSPHVANVIRDQASDELEESCLSIESSVSNGPLDHLGGALRTRVQLLIGHHARSTNDDR